MPKSYLKILSKLDNFIRKENRVKIASGILLTLFAASLTITFFSILELIFNFNTTFRAFLFFFGLLIPIGTFIYFLLIPFLQFRFQLKEKKYLRVASIIGNYFPEINDRLINSLQLANSVELKSIYSNSLIDAVIDNTERETAEIKFEEAVDTKKLKFATYLFSICLASSLIIFALVPNLTKAFERIYNYSTNYEPPPRFSFKVSPGNSKITKGDNLKVKAKVVGAEVNQTEIHFAEEGLEVFDSNVIEADSLGNFNYTFINPQRSFYYFFSAEEVRSEKYFVEVVNRPIIKSLQVKVIPPSYSKLPTQDYEDNGDINALFGSAITITLSANKNLSEAKIIFSDTSEIKFDVNQHRASVKFTARKNLTYRIFIYDEDKNDNLNPVEYQIKVSNDNPPFIALVKPESKNVNLTDDMRVSTLVKIKDDFGFSNLTLNYRLSYSRYEQPKEDYEKISIPVPQSLDAEVSYIWNLSALNLVTDDVVSYYFEVFDNDYVSGPKSARTEIFTARIPSLDEIITESDRAQEKTVSELQQTLKESEELKKEIESIDRDLKSARDKLTWEEQKKIEDVLKKQDNLLQKIDNVQENLRELQNKLSENKLLSKETIEKYMELQELFNQLGTEEMKLAMKRLNEALKNISKQAIQEAMKNFQFNEDMFRASLERTLNLLKRVQIEQKVDQILKRLDELQKQQDNLSERTNNTNPSDNQKLQELAEEQKQLSKEMNELDKELEELQKKMDEFPKEMPNKELEKMRQEFENENLSQCSNQASQEMRSGDKSKAGKNQQKIKSGLQKLSKGMSQLKQKMMQNQMQMTLNEFKKIISDILELSKSQEEAKNLSQKLDPTSPKFSQAAERQAELLDELSNITNQLIELSQRSFFVTPEMGKALGKAMSEMSQAITNMQNRNNFGALFNQANAMSSLNEAAKQIQDMMQNMMQGGQGMGMMSMMQRLQQMAQQQMNLNNLMQQLGQGQLTMEQMGQLQRLAAQQEMIKKSLEELNRELRESGQQSKMLGDLDDAVRKMEEVIREMRANNVNNEVIQKQEKILTRLLDAQRSMNERDYEKRRESKPGEQITRRSPSEIEPQNQLNKLQEDMLRAIEEGYAKDYEILIRKYFEALQKKLQN